MRLLLLITIFVAGPCLVSADDAEEIVTVGLQRGGLGPAKAIYESVKQPDARVEYAYGLVLLKHFRRAEAVEHFDACRGDASFLPGWEASLRLLASSREYDAVWAELPKLAHAVSSRPDDLVATEMARQLGRLVAAVELSSGNADSDEKWLTVLESLRSELQPTFDAGYSDLNEHAEKIIARAEMRRAKARERADSKRAATKARLEAITADSADEKEELKRTASDWTEYLEERHGEAKELVTEYQDELDQLEVEVTMRAARIVQLRDLIRVYARQPQLEESVARLRQYTGDPNRVLTPLERLKYDLAVKLDQQEEDALRVGALQQDIQKVEQAYGRMVARAKGNVGPAVVRFEELTKRDKVATARLERLMQEQAALKAEVGKQHGAASKRLTIGQLLPWEDLTAVRATLRRDH